MPDGRVCGWGPWVEVTSGDPADRVHFTTDEPAEEPETEDASTNVLPMNRRGRRPRPPSA
jgi:hypothetical protein